MKKQTEKTKAEESRKNVEKRKRDMDTILSLVERKIQHRIELMTETAGSLEHKNGLIEALDIVEEHKKEVDNLRNLEESLTKKIKEEEKIEEEKANQE